MGKILTLAEDEFSPENMHGLVLYDAPASPCARRCRITLLEKGLDWDTVNLNLGTMEQRSSDYLAINPNGYVPTLAHGKKVIFESGVINSYLEHQFPEVPLLPDDAEGIAQVRMWQSAELAMARIFRPVMYQITAGPLKRISRTEEENDVITRLETDLPSDLAWEQKIYHLEVLKPDELKAHQQWLMDWLRPVENALKGRDYLVNDAFSQADIAVFPRVQMYAGLGLKISPDDYPNLTRWMDALEQRDSFVNSQDEAARKYMEMTRSPMMQKLRQYFATPPGERTEESRQEMLEFGRSTRERLGVEKLLAASRRGRKIPQPRAGKIFADQKPCAKVRSRTPQALTLYGNAFSPHSERIRFLLDFLGQSFDYREVDLAAGDNQSAQFRQLNPLGEVPVLCADDLVIYDSGAIAEYLCHSLPGGARLWPELSFDRARHDMWLALDSGTLKEFTPLLHEVMFASNPARRPSIDDSQRSNLVERIVAKLDILENGLSETHYLMGDNLTFADLAWFSRIRSLLKTSIAPILDDFPAILNWLERLDVNVRHHGDMQAETRSA